jgi:peptidoglycan/xylan/chitin deacetylase (PgdA/CDA1 family)
MIRAPVGRRLRAPRTGLALVYHRIEPRAGDAATEFSPPLDCASFAAQLEHLRAHCRVVRACELPAAVRARRRGDRPPVAITFDDDLPTHRRWALRALRDAGLTATFFLNGASLDGPRTWWWDRLQAGRDRGLAWEDLLPQPVLAGAGAGAGGAPTVATVSEAVQRLTPGARHALHERLGALVGADPPDAGLRAADVRAIVAAGCDVGFHTRDHEPLSLVDDATLRRQLRDGRAELEALTGKPLAAVSYPHGKADARVAAAARQAGFRLGFTVDPAPARPSTDPLLIGRLDAAWPHVQARFGAAVAELVR